MIKPIKFPLVLASTDQKTFLAWDAEGVIETVMTPSIELATIFNSDQGEATVCDIANQMKDEQGWDLEPETVIIQLAVVESK